MSVSTLSEKDYTPVLSADIASLSDSVDDAEHVSALPTAECSAEKSLQGQRDVQVARGVSSSSSSSSSCGRGSERMQRNRGSVSSVDETDAVTSSSSQRDCSICDHPLHNLRSSQQQPLVRCTVCKSYYHESCCTGESGRGTELFVCSSCETASPNAHTQECEHEECPDIRLKTGQNQRGKRGRRTESEDLLAPPPKTVSRQSNRNASGSRATGPGAASNSGASILERTGVSNNIHPNILAALEECESYEFT